MPKTAVGQEFRITLYCTSDNTCHGPRPSAVRRPPLQSFRQLWQPATVPWQSLRRWQHPRFFDGIELEASTVPSAQLPTWRGSSKDWSRSTLNRILCSFCRAVPSLPTIVYLDLLQMNTWVHFVFSDCYARRISSKLKSFLAVTGVFLASRGGAPPSLRPVQHHNLQPLVQVTLAESILSTKSN